MRARKLLLVSIVAWTGCKGAREQAPPASGAAASLAPAGAPIPRAKVAREESSDHGEVRFLSGGAADLDGDGALELVAGGFSTRGDGERRSTVRVYRRRGERWEPLTESGWDGGHGSIIRNIELADADGDGRPEVIALGRSGATEREAKARLAVFRLERGALVRRAEIEWRDGRYSHGYGLAIGDLDGDGAPEIVTGGFQFDGIREIGFVRVWVMTAEGLALAAQTTLDGQGAPSMRINDLALGDVDGDGRAEIVVAGRHGRLKSEDTKHLDRRREVGDLSVLAYERGALVARTRHVWAKGTSLRLRTVVVADLDGDGRDDIVAGGQYDADGKTALGLFGFERGGGERGGGRRGSGSGGGDERGGAATGAIALRDDGSSTAAGVSGEIKDLIVAGERGRARVLATGATGDRPGRRGDVAAWRVEGGKLVRDASIVSRNGDETRTRALVLIPGEQGSTVLTIGHATNRAAMIGQVLTWDVRGAAPGGEGS